MPLKVITLDIHHKHIAVLSDRCAEAEGCLKALLNFIDPNLLPRHLYDYVAAVKELLG